MDEEEVMKILIVGYGSQADKDAVVASLTARLSEPLSVAYYPDEAGLREKVQALIDADAVCLMDTWWADAHSMALQTLAAWLRMRVVATDGQPVLTASLRG
jgi:hypothetical protein